jgi:hypothetical protein
MLSHRHILENSAELCRITHRINVSVQKRNNSAVEKAHWEQACIEFHNSFDRLVFPGGSELFYRVRENDPTALEAAVRFLEADPYHLRSGYLKERLWRWLPHLTLSSTEQKRLEKAALQYLDRQISREFWSMCKSMNRIGSAEFWTTVEHCSQSQETPKSFRALRLFTFKTSIHAGSKLRCKTYSTCFEHQLDNNIHNLQE